MPGLTDFKDEEIQAELERRRAAAGGVAKPRVAYDPKAATDAEVAVVRAARTRNPNTPAQFDQMTDAGRAAHWDRYFSKTPSAAVSPSGFWKSYAQQPTAAQIASTAGTGVETETGYGPVSSTTRLGDARSSRFGPTKAYGSDSSPATLPPAAPVMPVSAPPPSLTSDVPDFEPGSNVSFPPVAPGVPASSAPLPRVTTKYGAASAIPDNPFLPSALAPRPVSNDWMDRYAQQDSLAEDFRRKMRMGRPAVSRTY